MIVNLWQYCKGFQYSKRYASYISHLPPRLILKRKLTLNNTSVTLYTKINESTYTQIQNMKPFLDDVYKYLKLPVPFIMVAYIKYFIEGTQKVTRCLPKMLVDDIQR